MSYQLIVPPDVEREIAEIFDAFDSTDRALSFIEDLNVVFDRIADRPLQFPVIHTSVRRALRDGQAAHSVVVQHTQRDLVPIGKGGRLVATIRPLRTVARMTCISAGVAREQA